MAKPTINDVARLAGVSKKTVSRVINQSPLLNEATRAKVEQVIAEIGYAPDPQARALALRRNTGSAPAPAETAGTEPSAPISASANATSPGRQLLARVYDASAAPLLADVQHGMLAALRSGDHALAVCAIDGEPEAELRGFLDKHRPAGVVLLPPLSELKPLAGLCAEFGCKPVCLGAAPSNGPAELVASDDRTAAAQAVAYLVSLGHERIGMVTGPDDSRLAQQRELGYLDAMADHDLDRGPALIATGDHSFQSGHAAGHLLLEVSPRPTAIFAGNDEMAAGVLHAAAERGIRVPDGLSVMGFEDMPIAVRLIPPLATVRVPLADMTRAAALRLIAPETTTPERFAAELVTRASTGPVQG
jgi:LacI family transcriptional regulator